jgi:hypothetical protein
MHWPSIAALSSALSLPTGVVLRQFRASELDALPALIRAWYPAVSVGAESVFLDPAFLLREVAHEGHDADIFAFGIHQDAELVGMMSFERESAARTLHARLGLIAPSARAGFLGALGFVIFEALGRMVGAELCMSYVTLAGRHQQLFARRRGFRLVGVVPGFDRDLQPDGTVRRVTEALYVKSLVPDADLLPPALEHLTPEVQQLLALVTSAPSS